LGEQQELLEFFMKKKAEYVEMKNIVEDKIPLPREEQPR